jgi:CTP synthase
MVIDIMEDQKNIENKWWTMRLWAYEAILKKWSLVEKMYWINNISERHRHRYEVNTEFHNILQENWLIISWTSPDWRLVEFIELKNHPFFVATQAHPEFQSSLEKPHPLFVGLVQSCFK